MTISNWVALTLLGVNVFSALVLVALLVYLLAVSSSLSVVAQIMPPPPVVVKTDPQPVQLACSARPGTDLSSLKGKRIVLTVE